MKPAKLIDDAGFRALTRAAAARRGRTSERDRFLIYLLGKTGLRISEALSLRADAFWLTTQPPFLRVRTLKKRGGKAPTDEVLLDAHVARRASAYLRDTLPRLLYAQPWEGAPDNAAQLIKRDNPPIFPALRGGRRLKRGRDHKLPLRAMTRYNARGIFRTYVRLANLAPTVTLHSLRHYRGSTLLRTTGDVEFTRLQMRHSDAAATAVYQHVSPARIGKYLERLADADGDDA